MEMTSDTMHLDTLLSQNLLSQGTFTICQANSLKTIEEIKEYYFTHGSFRNLRNCGLKACLELTELCLSSYLPQAKKAVNKERKLSLEHLSEEQLLIVRLYLKIEIDSLTNRARNALNNHLFKDLSLESFDKSGLLKDEFEPGTLRSVGRGTSETIKNFLIDLKTFIAEIPNDEEEVMRLTRYYLLCDRFGQENLPMENFNSQSAFILVHNLIQNETLYGKRDTQIFLKAMNINSAFELQALDYLPKDLSVTRQRIEQIRDKILEELPDTLSFLKNIYPPNYLGISSDTDFYFLDEKKKSMLNDENGTSFSGPFLSTILTVLYDDFALVGSSKDTMIPKLLKSKESHYWNNLFLLKKDLAAQFDFIEMANDLHQRIAEKIDETYSFNLLSYLAKFFMGEKGEDLDKILPFCRVLIQEEFKGLIIEENRLVFSRTTKKLLNEYIYEALEILDEPSTIIELQQKLIELYPDMFFEEESLRGVISRNEDFKSYAKEGIYILTKWEKEKQNIKAGTIKEIVIDYLAKSEEPVHAMELIKELNKFNRGTGTKSLLENLKMDPEQRFITFNQKFVGLSSRTYTGPLTRLPSQLGKKMVPFIRSTSGLTEKEFCVHFSNKYGISEKNCGFILESLKERNSVFENDHKHLIAG